MSNNNLVDYDERKLVIQPEGWVNNIVFEDGKNHGCGRAYNGISVHIMGQAGGVLSNDDAAELLTYLKNHFKYVAGEPVWESEDEC